jgi:hypothetical protein
MMSQFTFAAATTAVGVALADALADVVVHGAAEALAEGSTAPDATGLADAEAHEPSTD